MNPKSVIHNGGTTSWHQNEVRKIADVSCRKFGHRIYVVKINRGAVIGKAVSPYGAYVRAYQFLKNSYAEGR